MLNAMNIRRERRQLTPAGFVGVLIVREG